MMMKSDEEEGKRRCVKWVDKYFKDCVCNLSSEISFGLGIVSLFCWGIAEIPQIVTNYQTQSGHGVSLLLLLTWVLGDIFNSVGCALEPVTLPTQYYTALLYTITTVVLVIQTLYYDYFIRWWKSKDYRVTLDLEDREERKALNPKPTDPTRPIPTSASTPSSPQTDVYFRSARSLANSGGSPYAGAYYMGSGPSGFCAADEEDGSSFDEGTPRHSKRTSSISRSIGYGTFIIGSAGLPSQAKALMAAHMVLYGNNMLQGTVSKGIEANPYGLVLGWIMAAIYMGGRLPQIYLNIKRGNVEGLNPLMFIFALIANATYVGSILVRSVEWDRIKANAPWLFDAIVCVLLDLFIIIQFAYYKMMNTRTTRDDFDDDATYGNIYDSVTKSAV